MSYLPDLSVYMPRDADGDGWTLDDATGMNPIDNTKKAVTDAIPKAPDPWGWATQKMEAIGEYGRENLPLVEKATLAMGLGMAATGGVVLVGGGFLLYETLHLLGNSRNVNRAIQAADPAELARAANPFGQGRK